MSGLFQDDTLPEPPASGPGLFGDSAPAAEPAPVPPPPAPGTPYRVLARKYRPTTFDDLIGQEAMVRTLRNAFALGRIAHAWMLTGVRGVGKTTTARIIARALNCVGPRGDGGPTADPCGACPNANGRCSCCASTTTPPTPTSPTRWVAAAAPCAASPPAGSRHCARTSP